MLPKLGLSRIVVFMGSHDLSRWSILRKFCSLEKSFFFSLQVLISWQYVHVIQRIRRLMELTIVCPILYSNTGLNHHPMVHNKWLCQSRWSLRTGGPSEQGKTNTACSLTSNLQVQNPRLAEYDSKCEPMSAHRSMSPVKEF